MNIFVFIMLKQFYLILISLTIIHLPLQALAKSHKQYCKVIYVTDGDSFKCLLMNKKKIRVRLQGIDAPEKSQPYGLQARKALVTLINKQNILLIIHGKDNYRRTLATAYKIKGSQKTNINLTMVKLGFAWVYEHYNKKTRYLLAQQQAQKYRKGLWYSQEAISPYQWRTTHKKSYKDHK